MAGWQNLVDQLWLIFGQKGQDVYCLQGRAQGFQVTCKTKVSSGIYIIFLYEINPMSDLRSM